MRTVLIALVCLSIGFGAGWAVFERPWEQSKPSAFDLASIERSLSRIDRVRDVKCSVQHGPFYSCTAFSSANGGMDYDVEVKANGRCFVAKASKSADELAYESPEIGTFDTDTALPSPYTAWMSKRSDC